MESWKAAVRAQFGAAIDMLENAIRACPEEAWPKVGYGAFHALFFLDLYLSESADGFLPPAPFGLEELDANGETPERVHGKDELLRYLEHGRSKCHAVIDRFTGQERRKFFSLEAPSSSFSSTTCGTCSTTPRSST
ncbi:MAG TPA: hypothetical protein VGR02_14495 [Thermoanaerobaculia bacterium]|jgi:hypothetical protein|nr:hypothetical protein [Thermoanaerobaculia bacterium]